MPRLGLSRARRAFTLIELSIVLAIIGLIIGGVIAGNSLVQAAKINAQVAQFKKFELAFNGFRLAYDAYPGDMENASSFWSTATNGNGNRLIDDSSLNACAGACGQVSNTGEKTSFFHHLSISGMVNEAYSTGGVNIGVSVPALAMYPSPYFLLAASVWYNSTAFGMDIPNPNATTQGIYLIASSILVANTYPFNPPEAAYIDRKMDDGYPTSGRLWGIWNLNCSTATTPVQYRTDLTKGQTFYGCGLQYSLQK